MARIVVDAGWRAVVRVDGVAVSVLEPGRRRLPRALPWRRTVRRVDVRLAWLVLAGQDPATADVPGGRISVAVQWQVHDPAARLRSWMTTRRSGGTMALMTGLQHDGEWTLEDIDLLPDDDHQQYELLDGLLLVTPAPVPLHQRAVAQLFVRLAGKVPPGVELLFAPLDWRPDNRTSLQPDVLAVRAQDVGPRNVSGPLVLAVEVLSPSTRRKDLVLKHSKYQDCGVEHYWVVDPEAPSIVAYNLVDGVYVETGRAAGDEEVQLTGAFAVTIRPSDLVAAPNRPRP